MMSAGVATTILPPLTPEESQHGARVRAAVFDALRAAHGWLPFSAYQRLVLYQPGLGYYSAGAAKFGPGGDFVTAPEISPVFGRAIARWLRPLLAGCGPDAEILELGAGSGALARELLGELGRLGTAPAGYAILEVSAELRARQRTVLTNASGVPVRWLDRLPENFRGIVLANEVLDALPCERFEQGPDGLLALGVSADAAGNLLNAVRDPANGAVELPDAGPLSRCYREFAQRLVVDAADAARALPLGYRGEFMPALAPFLHALAASLRQGAIVLIDYGLPRRQLYLPERREGTLRCIRRHHAHADPLRDPGLTDITAWVDFTAVAEALDRDGCAIAAFATQMAWLLDAGIDTLLADAQRLVASEAERLRLAQGVKTLLLPGEMGEAVKMLCATRGLPPDCGTVTLQDMRGAL